MKIDKRKNYFITLDTETTNNCMESKYNDGLVYDLGFVISDKKGNIYCKRSFIIREIFYNNTLMDTAYYKKKIPMYLDKIARKEIEVVSIWEARRRIKKAIEYFNIKEVYAYNANFDITVLNNTVRYLSKSLVRYFLPYGVQVCDIWHIACQVLGIQKTFQWENVRNAKNNLITNAERMFSYIEQIDFKEEHTGLADAIIENEILTRCFRTHKTIDKKINKSCWRLCQKVA